MGNPSKTLANVEDTLHSVIVSLIDGQKGFQAIGDAVKDELLKKYFLEESLKRAEFRGDLETVLHQEGVHDISERGSVAGAIHRAWAGLQGKMHEGDHALLTTAESAETETSQAYRDALDKELPLPVRQLLSTQAAQIDLSLDYVRAACDSSK
jgi:uncharacterized protein (TIGR02284 family)